ncbi:MAG: hypothetical protein K8F62_08070 [Pseudorhodoplanes sp.]|nr:hypothetical protein [Pseudorhodoplanes sp.]
MFQMLTSYFANVRVVEKNMTAASSFSPEDRLLVAEQLLINQRLIAIIERGGIEPSPLDDAAINDLLVESFHNCTKMGAQATALGGRTRRDPFLNLASTLQGLYTETIVVRRRASHKKFLRRINLAIDRFVESNLTETKRAEIEVDVRGKLSEMIRAS